MSKSWCRKRETSEESLESFGFWTKVVGPSKPLCHKTGLCLQLPSSCVGCSRSVHFCPDWLPLSLEPGVWCSLHPGLKACSWHSASVAAVPEECTSIRGFVTTLMFVMLFFNVMIVDSRRLVEFLTSRCVYLPLTRASCLLTTGCDLSVLT